MLRLTKKKTRPREKINERLHDSMKINPFQSKSFQVSQNQETTGKNQTTSPKLQGYEFLNISFHDQQQPDVREYNRHTPRDIHEKTYRTTRRGCNHEKRKITAQCAVRKAENLT